MKVQCKVCGDFINLDHIDNDQIKSGDFTCLVCSIKEKISQNKGIK